MTDSLLTTLDLQQHGRWLRRLALSLLRGDDASAEDVVQETCLAAVEKPPPSSYVRAWLAATMRNVVRNRLRAERRQRQRETDVARFAEEALCAEDVLVRHETERWLSRLVSELDEPHRIVVLLRHSEGLTPSQIAAKLGVPAGTIRWRLKVAHDRLRAALGADGARRLRLLAPFVPALEPAPFVKELVMATTSSKVVGGAAVVVALMAGAAWIWRANTTVEPTTAALATPPTTPRSSRVANPPGKNARAAVSASEGKPAGRVPRFVSSAADVGAESEEALAERLRNEWTWVRALSPSCAQPNSLRPVCDAFQSSLKDLALTAHKAAQKQKSQRMRELAWGFYAEYFQLVPESNPAVHEMAFYGADLLWTMERWRDAEQLFRKSLALNPTSKFAKEAKYGADLAEHNAARASRATP